MSIPPPPAGPPAQPPYQGGPPSPGGYGVPQPPPGGAPGPGGFGPGQPPGPSGGGFGPPGSGGFGPPGSGGGGNWPPPPPPSGGGKGKVVIATVVASVVVVALAVGGVMAFRGDDGKKDVANSSSSPDSSSSSFEPEPTDTESESPYESEDPFDDEPSDEPSRDYEEIAPTPTDGARQHFQMEEGDCFNLVTSKEGQGRKASCGSGHDAEVVYQGKLPKDVTTDSAITKKAKSLCKSHLDRAARRQAAGKVGGTLIQYPQRLAVILGARTVTCSLTAGKGAKIYGRLS